MAPVLSAYPPLQRHRLQLRARRSMVRDRLGNREPPDTTPHLRRQIPVRWPSAHVLARMGAANESAAAHLDMADSRRQHRSYLRHAVPLPRRGSPLQRTPPHELPPRDSRERPLGLTPTASEAAGAHKAGRGYMEDALGKAPH